jgi:GNAT superfamily N-acetyltransferase
MSDWELSTDPARLQLDVIHGWLRETYWATGVRRDVVDRAFAGSLAIGAYRGAAQIGVARAVTDRATFAWLCDVYVDAPARGQGLATAMVRALMDDPALRTLRRWMLATRDAHAVYRPLGYAPVDPAIFMSRLMPPSAWSETPAAVPFPAAAPTQPPP